ncbi:DUF2238 domain-containing protein [Pleionea sediminis]|uniref:DUF2238 domain-containing protein n=1 Tax=Pleionea sediminis TaxID=2569479 RepID=UPI001186671B|nr:DUF2238 domain-containing protein [Pleionea sediminis]
MKKVSWLLVFFLVLIWSGIQPKDTLTWFLEVLPAIIGLVIIASTYQRFPLTQLLYILILIHSVVLMIGGHYTYAEVPLGHWFQDWFGWQRNNYDKLGHFLQGFVPAIIARELFVRHQVINGRHWQNLLIISVCLAFSAFYELIEWWVALLSDEAAESFLGTQGYVWDTQSDMMYALIGAIVALVALGHWHDRQIRALK